MVYESVEDRIDSFLQATSRNTSCPPELPDYYLRIARPAGFLSENVFTSIRREHTGRTGTLP